MYMRGRPNGQHYGPCRPPVWAYNSKTKGRRKPKLGTGPTFF